MGDYREEKLAAFMYLADALGIDLDAERTAIATPKTNARATTHDGSLDARMRATFGGEITIQTPRGPGLVVSLVNPSEDSLAPEGAIYKIIAYTPEGDDFEGRALNNPIRSVYVGQNGFLFTQASEQRLRELFAPRE